MPSSILITGGAGFIGSHLVDRLLDAGEQVTVLDNFNDFYNPAVKRKNVGPHLAHDNYTLVEGDIRDKELVERTFRRGEFDEVIHLAAMAGVRPSIQRPVLYQEVNLIGSMNILESVRHAGIKKYIFASSSSVYGNREKVPFSESDRVDHPISPYAATKKAGEEMAFTYHHLYGIKTTCLRFFTVYGPRQRPEMAIHLFTDRIFRGEAVEMFGDGTSSRDYTFIDDIIEGVLACRQADYDFEIINLGRSDRVELASLISRIEQHLGKKARLIRKPHQPGDVERTCADVRKAQRLLGFKPKVSIDDGLQRFVAWYIENRGKS
jgi:UDP-glucuronate 4-epimerase